MIDKPGIYDMPMADYLADPCPAPSLSGGAAHTLLSRSPRHAWFDHPRLNPSRVADETTPEQDEGTALHALILENVNLVDVLDFVDFRTKEARAAREASRKAGRVPIKRARWEEIARVADVVRMQIAEHRDAADILSDGKPEQVMLWQYQDIWVRNRVDWLANDRHGWMTDVKTVAQSAEPGAFGRKLVDSGYAVSAALYLRGAREVGLRPKGYRWLVIERDPPHCISVVTMAPDLADLADRMALRALDTWRDCLTRNEWPAYPPMTAHIEAPAWASLRWEESEDRAEHLRRTAKPRPFHEASDPRVVASRMPFA